MRHNATDTLKVASQQKNKSGKTSFLNINKKELEEARGKNKTRAPTILAYLRKSTTKQDSIEGQNKAIIKYAKELGYTIEEENKFYDPGYSGYAHIKTNNGVVISRPRKGYTALLDKIISDGNCILFANHYSRIARNIEDAVTIKGMLGIGRRENPKIQALYMPNYGENGTKWDKDTSEDEFIGAFKHSTKESEDKRIAEKKTEKNNLEEGIYLMNTPMGIDRTKSKGKVLKINEYMPFVLKAWEMKAEGKDKGQIKRYLQLHGLNAPDSFEAYFKNTLYIGYYTNKETGEMLKINFETGKPPMDRELWERVQKTLGPRRVSKYGEKQNDISRLIRWEEDTERRYAFSLDIKKGKYENYKSNAFGGGGFSGKKLREVFMETIKHAIELLGYDTVKGDPGEYDFGIFHGTREALKEKQYKIAQQTTKDLTKDTEKEENEYEIGILEKEEKEIEERIKKMKRTALVEGYSKEELKEAMQPDEKRLSEIRNRKEELSQFTDMEAYLARLPEILDKTFELAERTLNKAENETFEKDMEKLLELVTFELTLNNKKELKVKLFEVFHTMENAGNCKWLPKPASIRTFIENYDRIAEKYGDEF